ncbi:hypothetical protein HDU86_002188 [Geranomyces michiganensis]|nr:hypothetical protein HDU86_002188 [Geranomyces michiganensis]
MSTANDVKTNWDDEALFDDNQYASAPDTHSDHSSSSSDMVCVWANGGASGAWSIGDKRHFAATLVSTLIDYSDVIAAAGDDINAATFPATQWNNWFSDGANPTADYCKDPRIFTTRPLMQPASFGMSLDAARSVRNGKAFCGCEVANGVPQFTMVKTKEHFVDWTDPAAQATAQFVGKQVKTLCSAHCAAYKAWCSSIPAVSTAHKRMTRIQQDLGFAEKTIRGFLYTGASAGAAHAFGYPAIAYACQIRNTWVIVGFMDAHSKAPTTAEVQALTNFTI